MRAIPESRLGLEDDVISTTAKIRSKPQGPCEKCFIAEFFAPCAECPVRVVLLAGGTFLPEGIDAGLRCFSGDANT